MFTWGVGEGMFVYFQPLALEYWGATPLMIGAIFGLNGIIMTIIQIPSGYLSDRIGTRPIMWMSWAVGMVGVIIMAISGSLEIFIAGMLVYGLSSFTMAANNIYIIGARGSWSVERSLSTVSAAYNLGAVFGPLTGGWIGEWLSLKAVYFFSFGIFLISTIIIFFIRKQPLPASHKGNASKIRPLLNPRFLVLMSIFFLTFFTLYLPQPLAPAFLKDVHHLSLSSIGFIGAIGSLGNAFFSLLFGGLNAPIGFLIGQVLVGGSSFLFWQSSHWALLALGYFCFGGYRLSRSMMLAFISQLIQPDQRGLAYGIVETMNAMSIIFAPTVAGYLYSQAPTLVFSTALGFSIAVFLITSIALLRFRASKPAPTSISLTEEKL